MLSSKRFLAVAIAAVLCFGAIVIVLRYDGSYTSSNLNVIQHGKAINVYTIAVNETVTPPTTNNSQDGHEAVSAVLPHANNFSNDSCDSLDSNDSVHIVISTDTNAIQGAMALLKSIETHSKKNITVHIVISSSKEREIISKAVNCSIFGSKTLQVNYAEFKFPDKMKQLITVTAKTRDYLKSPANYARFYFYKLFPCLSHIIYLDVDMVVQHDISELWKIVVNSDKLLVGVYRTYKSYSIKKFLNETAVGPIYKSRYNKEFSFDNHAFNAGVVGFNLQKWRDNNVTDDVMYWMQLHKQKPGLWDLGTQPIMYLIAGDDVMCVDNRWNVEGLGWNSGLSNTRLSSAYILHWNGTKKPWMKVAGASHYHRFWKKYFDKKCL